MSKPLVQTLKGFRDFLPTEKRQRDFITEKIKETFENFGFAPVETPTLEYASLLLGKYGEEADKLVYSFKDQGDRQVALRYDQTVPSARLLTQYQNQLPRYFRRYQIQNVFRADKPQAGRYREFIQCDIDIFGSTSPLADAEIIACTYAASKNIGFKQVKLKINDRQVLFNALQPYTTEQVDIFSIIQSIDKLDKKTEQEVVLELINKGLTKLKAQSALEAISQAQPSENLQTILQISQSLGVKKDDLIFTPTLARGLDYYTGAIFEVSLPNYDGGSCGGGGRYDRLIEELGGIDVPAVGIAFGFDRLVEAAVDLKLIPDKNSPAQVLVTILDKKWVEKSAQIATQLRKAGIATELFPDAEDDLGKQLKKANRTQIPYVVLYGENEAETDQVTLKNMASGKQAMMPVAEVIDQLT